MRAKRILSFACVIAVLLVAIALVLNRGNQHRFIDTSGEIVFASDLGSPQETHIFLEKPNGAGIVQLTKGNENDSDPSFSPDGSQIAYVSDNTGSLQVWVMDSDGQGARALTFGSGAKMKPRFGPDGIHLAYLTTGRLSITDLDTGDTSLILPSQEKDISTDTSKLAEAVREPVSDFAWSPVTDVSKSQIAAIQQTPDGDRETAALIPSSGGKPNVIFGARQVSVAWSPDGSQLAAACIGVPLGPKGKDISGIFLFNADGTPVQQQPLALVGSGSVGPQSPEYSPDSAKIVFEIMQQTALGSDNEVGIATTESTSGAQPQMVIRGAAQQPQFSPDGASLLFLGPSPQSPGNLTLYTANLVAGHAGPVGGNIGNITSAEWSPALQKKN